MNRLYPRQAPLVAPTEGTPSLTSIRVYPGYGKEVTEVVLTDREVFQLATELLNRYAANNGHAPRYQQYQPGGGPVAYKVRSMEGIEADV